MHSLPPLPSLDEIRERLNAIFPDNFPDRRILTGEMAVRTNFVALYGGFTEASQRFFRARASPRPVRPRSTPFPTTSPSCYRPT